MPFQQSNRLHRRVTSTRGNRAEFKLEEHLQQRVSLIGTLGLIRDELAAVEREKNVRLLSTLNREIAAIVRDNPAPFIYERIGNRYRNLFIDEFQDYIDYPVAQPGFNFSNTWYRWTKWAWSWATASRPFTGGETATTSSSEAAARPHRQSRPYSLTPPRHCGAHLPATLKFNRRSGSAIVDWNNRWFGSVQRHLPESFQGV